MFCSVIVSDGSIVNTTYHNGHFTSGLEILGIDSFTDRVYVHFTDTNTYIAVFNSTTDSFDYFYEVDSTIMKVNGFSVLNDDFMYIVGKDAVNDEAQMLRIFYSAGSTTRKNAL